MPKKVSKNIDFIQKVKVAVLDNGVDYNHPNLVHKISREEPGLDLRDNDFLPFPYEDVAFKSGSSEAYRSHGTHVAGIIAQNNDVEIIAVRRHEYSHSTDREAVEYAVKRGARIINLSFGDAVNPFEIPWFENWEPLYNAISDHPEILFITSAGNGYDGVAVDIGIIPSRPASFKFKNLISVGSVDKRNAIAADSNYGKESVLLGALGVNVESYGVNGKNLIMSGTSMAAPQVSRVASKILQINPTLKVSEVINLLHETATTFPHLEDKFISSGVLNEVEAIKQAQKSLGL